MTRELNERRAQRELAPISPWLLRPFVAYINFYLRRHFQGFHLLKSSNAQGLEGWPLLICMNHPSWWDPLFALYLSRYLFANRQHYGPIAMEGLNKYQFFEKLGFFGIDPKTRSGAVEFLRVGRNVLSRNDGAFWVTSQGQFTDVRIRPIRLQSGVAHLAHSATRFVMLPLALEFAFWIDRKPEAFAGFGDPIFVDDGSALSTNQWLHRFTDSLETVQDTLSDHVKHRRAEAFHTLFHTKPGVGGVYDLWQNLKLTLGLASRTRLP